MIEVSYTLDWLRFSTDVDISVSSIWPYAWAKPDGRTIDPLPAYNRCVSLVIGRVDWHDSRPQQRQLITLTGNDFVKLRREGISQAVVLAAALAIPNVTITRLDFAVDIKGEGVRTADVLSAVENGRVSTSARRIGVIREASIDNPLGGGLTLYVGSRSSLTLIRVYDKAAEQGISGDWVRLELEAKQEKAYRMAEAMISQGIALAGCAAIREVFRTDIEWIEKALNGEGTINLNLHRKHTDWEKWIVKVVIPNYERAVMEGLTEAVASYNVLGLAQKH